VTVLFCDLVGSTELSTRLDPEDLREILAEYQATATTAAARFEGYASHFLGDGIMLLFGYPRAHEDAAARAVRAALAIVEAVKQLSESSHAHRPAIAVRIGVSTGIVVAGDLVRGQA
jgi:class 3 adenylate cyclase